MIDVDVVPGYVPQLSGENAEEFRKLAKIGLPVSSPSFPPKVWSYLCRHGVVNVHFARYPRGKKAPTRLFIATRGEELRPWNYKFRETKRDKAVLQKYKDINPAIRALLGGAKFGSLPDRKHRMVLPGEEGLSDEVCGSVQ
ncbi:hypothetical protein DL93DRAFT_2080186 [Clavulina sp. PMI_390]|nr:hypothetical protein DL93DRAFT_2080186 [Clavulina sp. PMI_390]